MVKPQLVLAVVVLAVVSLINYINQVDELNRVAGGALVSLSVIVAVVFSPMLHLKDALFTDEMEGWLIGKVKPFMHPPFEDEDAHLEALVNVPDYDDEFVAWNALPHWKETTSTLLPPGCPSAAASTEEDAKADLFFVGPSTHYSASTWNADWRDPMTRYMHSDAILPQQVNIFNNVARLYFPQTRQMTGLGYLSPDSKSAQRASEMAYSDVKRAFEHYLAKYNKGRPFMLAGHSQGSEYVLRLLKDVIAPQEELKRQLVVVYAVGMPVYAHVLKEIGFEACSHAQQTGCVVSWQTYVEGASPEHFYFEPIHKPLRFNGNGGSTNKEQEMYSSRVCVNPLSWTLHNSTHVPREHNLGSMHLVQFMQNVRYLLSGLVPEVAAMTFYDRQKHRLAALLPLKPHLVGARCVNGSLWIDSPPSGELGSNPTYSFFPVWRFAMFPGSNMHPYDYNLFWANLRANAAQRVKAYHQS